MRASVLLCNPKYPHNVGQERDMMPYRAHERLGDEAMRE